MNFDANTAKDNFFKFHLKVKEVSRMIGETLIKEIEDKLKSESLLGNNMVNYSFSERFNTLFVTLKKKSDENINNILINSEVKMEYMSKLFLQKELEQNGFLVKDGTETGMLMVFFEVKQEPAINVTKAAESTIVSSRERFEQTSKQIRDL